MRTALRRKAAIPKAQVSASKSYPPPIGGWSTGALAAMRPTDAVALTNWFPKTSYVELRGGYTPDASSATGMDGNGKSLVVHNNINGTNKMFCSTATNVYDVSSPGAVGASVAARTSGKHQWTMFGDGTNNWLIMVNGADKPLYYDGSTWTAVDGISTPALTGVTTTSIVSVNMFKGRLFFILNSQLAFWYLAAGAAGGALTKFDLSGEAKRGGYLMAMATWTRDAGDGQDDVAVFVTSEGEVIVYQGNNPAVAANWSKVGTYFIGKPLGRRCILQLGGDVVIITQNGALPLSTSLQSAAIDYKTALSFKIEKAFTDAARLYGANFGWTAVLYPAQSAVLVNVPVAEGGEHQQYVMNTMTKSWCNFTDWDAEDFAIFNGDIYFTTSNKVVKAWTGTVDGANAIICYGKTAFSYFDDLSSEKQFKMFRPVLATNGNVSFLTDIDVDFNDTPITGTATYSVTAGARWDVDDWDEGMWASGLEVVKNWTSPDEWTGRCASGKIKIETNALTIQWLACDYIYEKGAIFG